MTDWLKRQLLFNWHIWLLFIFCNAAVTALCHSYWPDTRWVKWTWYVWWLFAINMANAVLIILLLLPATRYNDKHWEAD